MDPNEGGGVRRAVVHLPLKKLTHWDSFWLRNQSGRDITVMWVPINKVQDVAKEVREFKGRLEAAGAGEGVLRRSRCLVSVATHRPTGAPLTTPSYS